MSDRTEEFTISDEDAALAAAQRRLMERRAALVSSSGPVVGPSVEPLGAIISRLQERVVSPEYQKTVREHAERRKAGAREALSRRASECEMPEDEDLRDVVLDDEAPETETLRACRAIVAWRGDRRCGGVMVVAGVPGVGKTAGACHVLARTPRSGLFVPAADVSVTPRNGFSENGARWERWLSVDVLVVDDLGAESRRTESITELLLNRYDRGRCTLVTTNLTAKEITVDYFAERQGARLADRLVNAQMRAEPDGGTGVGGQPWYVYARGSSLRNPATREALRAKQHGNR